MDLDSRKLLNELQPAKKIIVIAARYCKYLCQIGFQNSRVKNPWVFFQNPAPSLETFNPFGLENLMQSPFRHGTTCSMLAVFPSGPNNKFCILYSNVLHTYLLLLLTDPKNKDTKVLENYWISNFLAYSQVLVCFFFIQKEIGKVNWLLWEIPQNLYWQSNWLIVFGYCCSVLLFT